MRDIEHDRRTELLDTRQQYKLDDSPCEQDDKQQEELDK